MNFWREERGLVMAAGMSVAALVVEHEVLAQGKVAAWAFIALLMVGILLAALRVAHHAEVLAEKFGEPFGTMILTLSAVLVEVVILGMMLSHHPTPTLLRDTIYSAVMLDINGILGLCAILGGLKFGEQPYNVDSGNTYIVMILTALSVSMLVPAFIPHAVWQPYTMFTIIIMLLLYAMFLRLQTGQHSYFFSYVYAQYPEDEHVGQNHHQSCSVQQSTSLLAGGLVVIGVLAEVLAQALDVGLANSGLPVITAALVVAVLSASPEILTSLRAALANRMQPVVNIALGASLSTVILTVPVIGCLALFLGAPIELALTPIQAVMLILTLVVASINLHDGETNAIEGMTHFVLFATFIMLSVLGL